MFGVAPFATLPIASIAPFERNESAYIALSSTITMMAVRDIAVWRPRVRTTKVMDVTARDTTETR
jgi:hypothetical protein